MDDKTKNKIKYQNRKKEVKWIPLTQKYMTTPWLDTGQIPLTQIHDHPLA